MFQIPFFHEKASMGKAVRKSHAPLVGNGINGNENELKRIRSERVSEKFPKISLLSSLKAEGIYTYREWLYLHPPILGIV